MTTTNIQSLQKTQSNVEAHHPDNLKGKNMTNDLMQNVTNTILEQLENGVAPWVKPWTGNGGVGAGVNVPTNFKSGAAYRGINTLILWIAGHTSGFNSGLWLTFKQAKELGGQVKKGSKGTQIAYYSTFELKDKNDITEDAKTKKVPFLKSYTVFALEQIEGLEIPAATAIEPIETRYANADEILAQAKIVFGGDRACFVPSIDQINLPVQSAFKTPADFYATSMHELTHWSGHKDRLNRDFTGRFGSTAYAREELCAELGAAYLCLALGIEGKLQHAEYIQSWIKVLKEDKKAIFQAAGHAQKAVDLLLKVNEAEESEDEAIAA